MVRQMICTELAQYAAGDGRLTERSLNLVGGWFNVNGNILPWQVEVTFPWAQCHL